MKWCPVCRCELSVWFSLRISAPARYYGKISKQTIRKREVELWGSNPDTARFMCKCGYHDKMTFLELEKLTRVQKIKEQATQAAYSGKKFY